MSPQISTLWFRIFVPDLRVCFISSSRRSEPNQKNNIVIGGAGGYWITRVWIIRPSTVVKDIFLNQLLEGHHLSSIPCILDNFRPSNLAMEDGRFINDFPFSKPSYVSYVSATFAPVSPGHVYHHSKERSWRGPGESPFFVGPMATSFRGPQVRFSVPVGKKLKYKWLIIYIYIPCIPYIYIYIYLWGMIFQVENSESNLCGIYILILNRN